MLALPRLRTLLKTDRKEEATMLLDDSKTTTLVTPPINNVRVVKNVKDDARKLLNAEITTYTSREAFESNVGPPTYCVDFDYLFYKGEGDIPLSSTAPLFFSQVGIQESKCLRSSQMLMIL
jgi:hypothetical protein